ncbi:unnamed protein product [Triticum turgidum subsp. durum]|uniref:Uncharacterized protein n=1 Tax=Triticum turgidum subsp. durum TaxID=4567 RepID=A0A9R0XLT6_TRITD|nr:unnamed protein product [Triticum turgidum subsp. durum]
MGISFLFMKKSRCFGNHPRRIKRRLLTPVQQRSVAHSTPLTLKESCSREKEERLREPAMAFADAAARRLLRGAGGGVANGIAADAVGMSFGLDGLWQLIAGLFASVAHLLVLPFEVLGHWLQVAIAAVAHLVALPFEALWHLLRSAAAGVGFCFDSLVAALGSAARALAVPFEALWHLLQSAAAGVSLCFRQEMMNLAFIIRAKTPKKEVQVYVDKYRSYTSLTCLSNLVAALGSAAHALAVPFKMLWQWLQAAPASISFGLHGLGQLIQGCFDSLVAALGSAPHALVVPFEAVWQWLQAAAAGVSSGLDGFWEHMQGIFAGLPAALASAAHSLVLPLESLWRWVQNAVGGISLDLAGFWPLVQRFVDTAASKAYELVPALEAFWRWLKDAAVVALPYVVAIAAVVCVAALVWYCYQVVAALVCHCWQFRCTAAVQVAPALGRVLCFCRDCLTAVATWVVLSCSRVTMVGPGAAGALISRTAFAANPRLYFKILRLAGPVVAAAVFSSSPVAWVVGAVVGVLFSL